MAALDIHAREASDGIRFSWNVWPQNRLDSTRVVVSPGCLYTPLKDTENLRLVEYDPVTCKSRDCESVLNPFCMVDFRSKSWTCPFCHQRNNFPAHYAEHITEQNLPAELIPQYTTIEYILPHVASQPPVFLFVIDTALIETELQHVTDSVQQVLQLLPTDAVVGLITFGAMTYVHELGFSEMPKAYAFRGTKPVTAQQVSAQLGFAVRNDPRGNAAAGGARRFLLPIGECEFAISSILDDLQKDSFSKTGTDQRPTRCTGVALSVAVGLMETTNHQSAGRTLLLTGGPCTIGPGQVVSTALSEPIRSHTDLQQEQANAKYTRDALKYYAGIARRAIDAGHAIDIIACNLDQVGLFEMKVCVDRTGGLMVMGDSFSTHLFQQSFRKAFEPDDNGYLQMGFNAKMNVLCTREIRIAGAVGNLASSHKAAPTVSENGIGESSTHEWTAGALSPGSTVAYYFEVVNQEPGQNAEERQGRLQFQTLYTHPSGRRRLRVTTTSHAYAEASKLSLAAGFDQEAAAVLMARSAVWKTEDTETLDVLRWCDRMLIRLVSRFADYRKDDPTSFSLMPEFSIYPQFMYHLRRSQFLQTFNASPDETAYYRTLLCRENVMNSLVMIQPALLEYSFEEGPPKPVLLDASSLKANVILVLDTFFHVVIWKGETIQQWFEAKYQDMPEYANFRQLLIAPEEDCKQIIDNRFPAPKFIQTAAGGSQARFLMAKVNPSVSHNSQTQFGQESGAVVLTDDVSLRVFMDHLIRLAVQS